MKTKKAKGIERRLDDLWSLLIRVKAGNMCEFCGKVGILNSHHIYSRSNKSIRWDEQNGICLCVTHHTFGNFSAHKAPTDFIDWIISDRGELWMSNLNIKANTITKFTDADKGMLILYLEEKLKEACKEFSEQYPTRDLPKAAEKYLWK